MKEAGIRLVCVKIPVSDLSRAVAYYRDVLGMEERVTLPEYGWASLAAGEVRVGLHVPDPTGGERPPGGQVGFQLAADDLASLHDRLAARGAALPLGLFQAENGIGCLLVVDPDGNVISIIGSAGPVPEPGQAEPGGAGP